jgi:hypothetical protein
VWRFAGALAFNWLIASTDAHAKNYGLLLAGRQIRLAPLYDIASILPYDSSDGYKLRRTDASHGNTPPTNSNLTAIGSSPACSTWRNACLPRSSRQSTTVMSVNLRRICPTGC